MSFISRDAFIYFREAHYLQIFVSGVLGNFVKKLIDPTSLSLQALNIILCVEDQEPSDFLGAINSTIDQFSRARTLKL